MTSSKTGEDSSLRGVVAEPAGVARVMIVDDHPVVRQGLAQVIGQYPKFELVGEFGTAADALSGVEGARPDLAIVDLSLGDTSGIELIGDLKRRMPSLSVLVLSMLDEDVYAERAIEAGADGFVSKAESLETVLDAARAVLAGELSLSRGTASLLVRKLVSGDRVGDARKRLTERQLEVFELLGSGFTSREIAEKLHVSVKTIDSHREHIKQRLELADGGELLRLAITWASQNRDLSGKRP